MTAGDDDSARVWETQTGAEVLTLKAQSGAVHSASFSPDGFRILTGHGIGTTKLWGGLAAPISSSVLGLDEIRRKAEELVNTGTAAFQQGKFADAATALEQASEHFRTLRKSRPSDPELVRQHGVSLRRLSTSLQELKRPGEALVRNRDSIDGYAFMMNPQSVDYLNMARNWANVSALDVAAPAESRERSAGMAVEYLRRAIEGDPERYLPRLASDRDFDAIRNRADFRDLMLDAAFPKDPFEQPSPLGRLASLSADEKQQLSKLSQDIEQNPKDFQKWCARGEFFARRKAWEPALPDYRKAIELHPLATSVGSQANRDAWFAMQAAILLLQAGDREGYRRLALSMLDKFAEANDAITLERTAKVNLLVQPTADAMKRIEVLAQLAVELGEGSVYLGYFQMARGMAAYRSGEFAKAVEWLEKSSKIDPKHGSDRSDFTSTWKSYLAMAEFRLGHSPRARTLLDEASDLIAAQTAQNDLGEGLWHDIVIADMARREAEALINPNDPSVARMLPQVTTAPLLYPLRSRADLKAMVLDAAFPEDPFEQPSPLRFAVTAPLGAELAKLSDAVARQPADFASWLARGKFYASHNEWASARSDFLKVLELHPPNQWLDQNQDTSLGFEAGLLFLQAGDREGQRQIARAMLDRFATSEQRNTLNLVTRLNLFVAPPAEDLKQLDKMTAQLLNQSPDDPYCALNRGMALFRSGDYEAAVKYLRKAESVVDKSGQIQARFFLAMAEHRLGKPEQALNLFRDASRELDTMTNQESWGARWFAVAATDVIRREAEALLERTTPKPAETKAREK